MSIFIENEHELYKQLSSNYSISAYQHFIRNYNKTNQKNQDLLTTQIRKIRSSSFLMINENQSQIYLSLKGSQLQGIFSSLISISFSKKQEKNRCKIYVVQKNQKYYQFLNHNSFKQACKIINKNDKIKSIPDINFRLNIETRQLVIVFPHIFSSLSKKNKSIIEEQIKILNIFTQLINHNKDYIMKIIQQLKRLQQRFLLNNQLLYQDQLKKIDKYRQMMNVLSSLSENSVGPQSEQQELQQKRRQSIQKLKNNYKIIQKQLSQSFQFFIQYNINDIEDFYLKFQEIKYIKLMISMPMISTNIKSKNQNQNIMILNHIKIKDINKIIPQKINQGGFAIIQISQIGYWYVYSSDGEQLIPIIEQVKVNESPKSMLVKWVVVKRQLQLKGKKYSRNKHEIKIVKKMKNGASIFLPKYYVPINANINPSFHGAVVLDFLQMGTLSDYLLRNNKVVSLQTKLSLMFSISQALRYLRWFNVVHLDLKPQNIMMHLQLLVKLIDFGQSYHPQICKKGYNPGFSIPYSPPQIFGVHPKYTHKCDVFSMGVIFHQILYGRCPFEIQSQNITFTIQFKSFIQYCHFCPQDLQTLGHYKILRLINSIIQRCLQTDPNNRPELDWVSLMLRQIIQTQF